MIRKEYQYILMDYHKELNIILYDTATVTYTNY